MVKLTAKPPGFVRYWFAPVTNQWNVNNATWLTAEHVGRGDFESSQDCYMTARPDGEIWEFCRNAALSLDGRVPFPISKYRLRDRDG